MSNSLSPRFYLFEDDDIHRANTHPAHKDQDDKSKPFPSFSFHPITTASQDKVTIPAIKDINEILKFPIESSHAYSYAQLSPNSLALRLNVLKRSLEILQDRPSLIQRLKSPHPDDDLLGPPIFPVTSNSSINSGSSAHKKSLFKLANNSHDHFESFDKPKNPKLQNNASSAALAAFFRPQMKRADSHPLEKIVTNDSDTLRRTSNAHNDDALKEIIALLDSNSDSESLWKDADIANTLHDLSLSSNEQQLMKQDLLKNKLLYALATPFVETSSLILDNNNPITPKTPTSVAPVHQSSIALNLLNIQSPQNNVVSNNNMANRPFHSSSSKRGLPQSVFTVSIDNPWNVKAANDLACLMFGVSRTSIKSLTLMDLIAPQFRDFVADRLARGNLSSSLNSKLRQNNLDLNDILFAGEIVAISRPGDHNFAYTSLWAKKKGNLIICMFDQIPCDAFDVVISCEKESEVNIPTLKIDSINEIAGNFFDNVNTSDLKKLDDLSQTLAKELDTNRVSAPEESSEECCETEDSEFINRTRYYTLQSEDQYIPCAITSIPLDRNLIYEIKLKIHALPYIAGMFVIDSKDYSILSCNNAIAKNLFGKSALELQNKSIDILIPKFSKIVECGFNDNADLTLTRGLVLPEHFFRKYDAVIKCEKEGIKNEEDLFFQSKGIEGIHRDGNPLLIDVQLRDSGDGTLVIWITYSRSSNRNISKDLEKLSSSKPLLQKHDSSAVIPELSAPRINYEDINLKHNITPLPEINVDTDSLLKHRRISTINHMPNLPSQLKLVPDELEFAPSSSEISRQNSTRKPKAGTFGIPVQKLNKTLGDLISWDTREKVNIDETQKIRSISNNSIITSADSYSGTVDTDDTSVKSDTSKVVTSQPSTYSEEEMLKLEHEILNDKIERSTEWPREVGLKRRTKKFSEFCVLKNMGEGAYGKVVLAVHDKDPVYKIIIKCIDKERILVDTWVRDRRLGTIPSEIQIMANLNSEPHPNIMRIIDFFEDEKYYYLETPIFGNPPAIDLFDFIEVKTDMMEAECKFIFKQICSAIYHLHKHGIVHRDIKDENVIVDENGIIKLIDFGSAGYTKQGPFDVFVGTIDYASPEVLRGEKYEGKPQDIWALGILLYTMLYKENPFYNVDEIMEGDLRIPGIISDGSLDLIKKILVRDLQKRPTITDILEHEWLQ